MPSYPINLPASFRFLNGDQDRVMDNIVEAKDSRGQIQARNLGGGRWMGSFNLIPMGPNDQIYNDWRAFISQLRQSFGTFKMPVIDILTGQRYKLPPCFCFIAPGEAGDTELIIQDVNRPSEGSVPGQGFLPDISELRWITLDDNLYEIIAHRPALNPAHTDLSIINPPLAAPFLGSNSHNLSDTEAYCIARATTVTKPTIDNKGMYTGAGIQWTQVLQT